MNFKKLFKKHHDAFVKVSWFFLGYVVFSFYNTIGFFSSKLGTPTILMTSFDKAIPFIPEFIFLYSLAYLVPVVSFVLLLIIRKPSVHEIARVVLGLVTLVVSHFIIYLIFPTSGDILRVSIFSTDSFVLNMLAFQYSITTTFNAFPSLHVASQLYILLYFRDYWKKAVKYLLPVFIGIAISTVFVKIHFIVDIFGGLITGFAGYHLFYKRMAHNIFKD